MRITILGSGGGRWVFLKQLRGSGGFVLELEDQKIHVDPGPGALVRAREFRVNLCDLTAVVVSHRHQDHMNDAIVAIESMTRGATRKGGAFISTQRVIEGEKGFPSILDDFHRKVLDRLEVMKPGDSVKLGKVKVTAIPTKHGEPDGIGFLFGGEGLRIGYTGDGEYFPGMEKYFEGCDYLIMNVMRPRTDSWPGHMNSEMARELVSKVRPTQAIMTHFGMKMLRGVAEKEATWLQKETGVKTVAARDGMVIGKGGQGRPQKKATLERFMEEDGD